MHNAAQPCQDGVHPHCGLCQQFVSRLRAPEPPPAVEIGELTLLVAEDDQVNLAQLLVHMEGLFKEVITAVDGEEAFRLFCRHTPDIVLTDQVMPGLTGLELMLKIRETGARTPVVLMTSVDGQVLLEAINKGVERFIPKPVDFDRLRRTLYSIAREIASGRAQRLHREQEVELLRYRDAYNSMQQESARRKERHLVRHDLRNVVIEGADRVRWALNVSYAPRDIMCGDGYSVRRLFDGRLLVFVLDAMGSGMSASLTAMLTTSFLNYQVDYLHMWETFTLQHFLRRFQQYAASVLLEDEVISCGFFLVDLVRQEIETALFALPPVLLRGLDGSVHKIPGSNPPLGVYPSEVRIRTVSIADAADLLIMTDGITEAALARGGSYREVLEDDFGFAPSLKALQRRFRERTLLSELDDLTVLHLGRLDLPAQWSWCGEPELNLRGLGRLIAEFLGALQREMGVEEAELDQIEIVLTEALTNALEHGCLGLEREEKARLLLEGEYDEALARAVTPPGAAVSLAARVSRTAQSPLLILEVRDSGSGVPPEVLRTKAEEGALNGRGFKMIRSFCDSIFVGGPGGHLIMLKTIGEGEGHAD